MAMVGQGEGLEGALGLLTVCSSSDCRVEAWKSQTMYNKLRLSDDAIYFMEVACLHVKN